MKRFYIYLFAAFCTVFLGACTGNFRDMNDDLTGISDEDLEATTTASDTACRSYSRGFISTTISARARTGRSR